MAYTLRLLAATALLLALPTNLAAQGAGQTPENAQAFLTKVFATGGVMTTAKPPNGSYGVSAGERGVGMTDFPMGRAKGWTHIPQPDGRFCVSQITAMGKYSEPRFSSYAGAIFVTNALRGFYRPTDDITQSHLREAEVNWSGTLNLTYVPAVEVVGAEVTLPMPSNDSGLRFRFPTEDMAKRAGFAMEVIRLSCDPTADENF